MSLVKVTVVCGLAALLISACGITAKPEAGSSPAQLKKSGDYYGRVDNPALYQVRCLKTDKLKFRLHYTLKGHFPVIQIGKVMDGPKMIVYPTGGIVQGLAILGDEQGAEIINQVALYPNQATGKLLKKAEACAAAAA
jgi:hypothetical protein